VDRFGIDVYVLYCHNQRLPLKLPVKVHLENPLFDSKCYVGSSSTPIWWELTTYKTNPPAPNKPIEGSSGKSNSSKKA